MATYQFPVLVDGFPTLLSPEEVRAILGTAQEPDKPVPVYGEPRTLEGYTDQGLAVFSSSEFNYPLLQISQKPDAIAPRGTNLPYTPLPGRKRLAGNDTDFTGSAEPNGFVQPPGYRVVYFRDEKGRPKPKERYFEQSKLPDEVIDTPVLDGSTKPGPPPTANNQPQPDPDQKRATLNDQTTS